MGAIAAGCTAVIKPSELCPTVSNALADLFPKYLDPDLYRVVNGGIPETTKVLTLVLFSSNHSSLIVGIHLMTYSS